MGPKKASKSTEGDSAAGAGTATFKWEGPNEVLLLTLIQGRYVKPEEYPCLLEAFPGTNIGGIRNRIGTLRTKQRQLYETYGWGAPEGLPVGKTNTPKATPKEAAATPGKRAAADVNGHGDGDDDGELETPSKKPAKKRAKKVVAGGTGGAAAKKAEEEEEEVEESKEYIKMEPDFEFDGFVNMDGEEV